MDSDFGIPGAITLTNKHQQEFFMESITIEGFACGPVHFPCNSWVQPRKDHPGKRIFFSNKVKILNQLFYHWSLSLSLSSVDMCFSFSNLKGLNLYGDPGKGCGQLSWFSVLIYLFRLGKVKPIFIFSFENFGVDKLGWEIIQIHWFFMLIIWVAWLDAMATRWKLNMLFCTSFSFLVCFLLQKKKILEFCKLWLKSKNFAQIFFYLWKFLVVISMGHGP